MTHDRGDRLRDAFFAVCHDPRAPSEQRALARRALLAEVATIDDGPTARLQGLDISYYPTARYKLLRFIPAAELEDTVRPRFARPCAAMPELAAVFVDPEQLGYHCFENIVGLDRLFTDLGRAPIDFAEFEPLADGLLRARFTASAPLADRLAQLDELGLYARPFDPSRGGLRFIFHSAELAAALTAALREALPAPLLRGFVHVNPVFRCNRFEPDDAEFASHVDSPYHDAARHHVSKHTLLLYLTPGRGDAPLRFADGYTIREIAAMTAFVFEQRLAHEGRPYADGRKVFLRTELVHEDHQLERSPAVGALFARACYLGSESVFTPELATLAHEAYDRAAAAHWRGPTAPPRRTYLHKRFRGAHFVTDGHEYWFPRRGLALRECAALALLDLLHATVAGAPFRRQCHTQVRFGDGDQTWIGELLREQGAPDEPVFAGLDKAALFPEPEPRREEGFDHWELYEQWAGEWDPTTDKKVHDVYARAQRWAMARILAAPIVMLGKELFLDPTRFVVEGDHIHVLSRERPGPLHFAGAVFFKPADFVGVDMTLEALQPLVPPMQFRELDATIHLRCDLFRNAWMVSHTSETVPVPRILVGPEVVAELPPWLHAASLDLATLRSET